MSAPFWEAKRLDDMTAAEWDALCDGCGLCCFARFRGLTGEVMPTRVHCADLDPTTRRCGDYANRTDRPWCVQVTPENVGTLETMPASCAYRRLAEGRGLPDWHPLLTGDQASGLRANPVAGALPSGTAAGNPNAPVSGFVAWDVLARERRERPVVSRA